MIKPAVPSERFNHHVFHQSLEIQLRLELKRPNAITLPAHNEIDVRGIITITELFALSFLDVGSGIADGRPAVGRCSPPGL